MNRFFKITDQPIQFNGIKFSWPLVSPVEGTIDIIKDFQWKNNMTVNAISEVPAISLKEYTLPYGKWTQNILNLFKNIADLKKQDDPYGMLYEGIATGFNYRLPYLIKPGDSLNGDIVNTWKPLDLEKMPVFGGLIKTAIGKSDSIASFITSGFSYETPQTFESSNNKSVSISFPLYNTVDIKKTIDNFWFVQLFALQNLKIRTTYLTHIPPKIYTVESEGGGGVFMPAAYVSNYSIKSIGATREIDIGNGSSSLIPEAYKVTITLTSLIPESTNIYRGAANPNQRISVIKSLALTTPEAATATVNAASNVVKEVGNIAADATNYLNPFSKK